MNDGFFPDEFRLRMIQQLGEQWPDFESAHINSSPTSIRVNPLKGNIKHETKVPWTSTGFYLPERPSFTLDPNLHGGAYYVQDASSMFLEQAFNQVVDTSHALNVLDLCAAPGGKSTHLLSLMNSESLLVTNEVIRSRANILSENIQKWGHDNVIVTGNDPEAFNDLEGFFDVIVVDAPCSGEGLFRKDRDALQSWSPQNVQLCSKRQRRILQDIWPALREGGHLIYSTCTYSESENEDNLNWLQGQVGIEFVKLEIKPDWNIEVFECQGVIGYRLYPHRVRGEGFFLSVVKKVEPCRPTRFKSSGAITIASRKIMEKAAGWISDNNKIYFQHKDQLRFFPSNKLRELEVISRNLYINNAGTLLATLKHDKLIPEHAAALSGSLNKANFETVHVDYDHALKFLRKEVLPLDNIRKGFALVSYNDLTLGWLNVLSNRSNNLYPVEWRIRM